MKPKSSMCDLPYINKLTPKAIWSMKQNKPRYIAQDLELYGIKRNVSHAIMLARGVYKWFAVRRALIKLKQNLKFDISCTQTLLAQKDTKNKQWLRGYMAAKVEDRKAIRGLCHSDRWQAPENDRDAQRFLEFMEE